MTVLDRMTSRKSRRGATALEYALVLAFVAVVVLAALVALGGTLTNTMTTIGTKVTKAGSSSMTK